MKGMTLKQIAAACGGNIILPEGYVPDDREAQGVVIDSRQVEEGFVFIATKGARVDGHSFIEQVAAKGAMAAVVEDVPEVLYLPCIQVKDSFKALKDIASYYRGQLNARVVGITGSVGKTSTKEMIASVLSVHYRVLKTEGNFNNEVGLPLTVLKIKDDTEIAVLEMGISEFGEMTRLSAIARPDICVITNIGTCHLENLGDRDGVLKAKTEIFTSLNPEGYAVLYGDDDKLSLIESVNGKNPIRYGSSSDFDVFVTEVESRGLLGSKAVICDAMGSARSTINAAIPLAGRHMVNNAMAATAVAHILGLTEEEIKQGLENVRPTSGRSNIIQTDKYILIDDCYNANPTSTKAAIDLLNDADGRRVAILGDMFELGDNECELHGDVGKYCAGQGVDLILCIGKLSEYMYEGADISKSKKQSLYYFKTVEEAMQEIPSLLQKGDTVLIKASHGMHFENIVSALNKAL